jgi:Fic family protein
MTVTHGTVTHGTHKKEVRLPGSHIDAVFEPHPIAHSVFAFRTETQAKESKAVASLVRFDERMRLYPYPEALMRVLIRAEAIATVRTDGICPDLKQVIVLEEAARLGKERPRQQKNFLYKSFPESKAETREASFEAYRCIETLRFIANFRPLESGLELKHLMNLHELCIRGTRREDSAGLRSDRAKQLFGTSLSGVRYYPPDPLKIVPLLRDLMSFSNRADISPLVRSIVSHFQLEAIRPFNQDLDRLGRMFALLIQRQGGLMENILTPFSLTPAILIRQHTELLIPYRTGQPFDKQNAMLAIDKWVAHSAQASDRSVRYAEIYSQHLKAQVEKWQLQLREAHRCTGLDVLLTSLVGMPMLTVADIMRITKKSFQSANEYVNWLGAAGILKPATKSKRNRLFMASDVLTMLKDIEQRFFLRPPQPRELFFKTARG